VSSPLRVVARVHAYPPECNAGAEMMLHSLLRALVAAGHDCTVVLTQGWTRRMVYDQDGVTVVPLGAVDDERLVRKADVVITHLHSTERTAGLARVFGRPLVQLLHNDFGSTRQEVAESGAALLVFNTYWLRDAIGAPGIVVHPPVFPEDYRTDPGDRVTLVNLADIKGGDVFWTLAARMPDVRFLGVKGGYGRQVIYDFPNVEVVEHTTDMRSVYGRTRLLLMPSEYESWGRVAVEAMCSGIPVIAADEHGPREALQHSGVLLPRHAIEAWEEAIRNLLRPAVYETASARARARADELDAQRVEDLGAFVAGVEWAATPAAVARG
jgi:glycosyltransferase involved in cell wall biosynthesis